jgi:hypothetical protein
MVSFIDVRVKKKK